MARYDDGTAMGGENRAFPVTRWTDIVDLGMSDEAQKTLIINELLDGTVPIDSFIIKYIPLITHQ